MLTIPELLATLPQTGRVEWIGIRPDRGAPIQVMTEVEVSPATAITGDRYGKGRGKRQVTLIQFEHLAAMGSMLGGDPIPPEVLRRNIVVRGLNLLALKDQRFRIGTALLEYTGLCQPCSKMELALGSGGYNAMRGHGGINARIIESGRICTGDEVKKAD